MPAATGRRSSHRKIVTSITAVISELCPEMMQSTAAGESSSAASRRLSAMWRRATAKKIAALSSVQSSSAVR